MLSCKTYNILEPRKVHWVLEGIVAQVCNLSILDGCADTIEIPHVWGHNRLDSENLNSKKERRRERGKRERERKEERKENKKTHANWTQNMSQEFLFQYCQDHNSRKTTYFLLYTTFLN